MRRTLLLAPSLLALPLVLVLTSGRASAAWPTGSIPNVPVCTAANQQELPAVAPDSCGGVILAWKDLRTATQYQVFVQRIDAFGQARWTLDGFPVSTSAGNQNEPDACSDGSGGAYVAWNELQAAATGRDIFVQHVLSTGIVDPAWPPDGLAACALPNDQSDVRIVPDGSGGAVVTWIDLGDGNVDIGYDLGAQRVSASGALLWGPNGVALADGPGNQAYHDAAPTGDGGIMAAWEDTRSGNNDIVAQRLDGAGARLWGATGLVLCNASQSPVGTRGREVRTSFEGGRAFVAWMNSTIPPAPERDDVFAQAIGPPGTILWTPNGVWLNGGYDSGYSPRAVPDDLGGLIVAWNYASSTSLGIVAQRVGASGSPLWTPGGVVLRGGAGVVAGPHCIVSDARNGAIVVWHDYRNGSTVNIDLYAQRVSDAGTPVWTVDGAPIATSPEHQELVGFGRPLERAVPDGAGGAVVGFGDLRNLSTTWSDIYAQQIGAGGLTGVRAPSLNCQPDVCGYAYDDFGDAPENIPAFPSGGFGHYPTCKAPSSPGTQEIECAGAALSTPPGPTGYVEHVATSSDAAYVSLGCRPGHGFIVADTEIDGLVNVGGGPPPMMSTTSACDPAAVLDTYENAFGGLWFGGDEQAGPSSVALTSNPVFRNCATASLHLRTSACGPQNTTAYLNVLVDWNQDGDWNDVARCGVAGADVCAPEWAVKNAPVTVRPGCDSLDTPVFQVGPNTGGSWMRITLTLSPVTDDFPWAGSAVNVQPGGGASGSFAGGETEDYPVSIVPALDAGDAPVSTTLLLAPVAPNPTTGAADVRFSLPAAVEARLGVYDLAGRRVRELAAGRLAAGSHTVRWDGRDASGAAARSGLYFVRLDAAGRTLTRTVVRMK